MEAKPVYRPREPRFVVKDLAASVYMDALAASQRDMDQTMTILEVAKDALQRLKAPEEPEQDLLPHAADIERMAPQSWKRGKARKHTRSWDEEDDDAPYDM